MVKSPQRKQIVTLQDITNAFLYFEGGSLAKELKRAGLDPGGRQNGDQASRQGQGGEKAAGKGCDSFFIRYLPFVLRREGNGLPLCSTV